MYFGCSLHFWRTINFELLLDLAVGAGVGAEVVEVEVDVVFFTTVGCGVFWVGVVFGNGVVGTNGGGCASGGVGVVATRGGGVGWSDGVGL